MRFYNKSSLLLVACSSFITVLKQSINSSKTGYLIMALVLSMQLTACNLESSDNTQTLHQEIGFNPQGDIRTSSDGMPFVLKNWAAELSPIIDNGEQPSFNILYNSQPNLFSVQPSISYPNGDLSFTTHEGTSGIATVDVILATDKSGEFGPDEIYTFTISIQASQINKPPVFTVGKDVVIEDTSKPIALPNWIVAAHDGNATSQHLTFEITGNSTPELFIIDPWVSYPSKTLRFTPVPGSQGTAHLTIRARDNGGTENGGVDTSSEQSFSITINGDPTTANIPPGFVVGDNVTVAQNSRDYSEPDWIHSVSSGDANTRNLHFVITNNDHPELFAEQPWVSYPSKTLRFTPKTGASGIATLSIHIEDKISNLQSESQTFTIQILKDAANQIPTFTPGRDVEVEMNSGDAAFPAWAKYIDEKHSETRKLVFEIVSVENPNLFASQPTVSVPSGTLRFHPQDNKYGKSKVSIRLKEIGNRQNMSRTATFTITIKGPQNINRAPVALADKKNLWVDDSITFELQANDSDGDELSVEIVKQPSHGTVTLKDTFTTYSPKNGYSGVDQFTFRASDGMLVSNEATIDLVIEKKPPENTAPIASNAVFTLQEDSTLIDTLIASDKESNTLSYTITRPPTHGVLTGNYPKFTYQPTENYQGEDSFAFQVNDGQLDSNVAVVNLHIKPLNDTPIAFSSAYNTVEETPVVFTLSAFDPDGDVLDYKIEQQPVHGLLEGTAPLLTYTPNKNYSGKDSLAFSVSDASGTPIIATVTFNISAINDKPTVDDLVLSTVEDTQLDITPSGYDGDADPLTFTIVHPPLYGELSKLGERYIYTPNLNYNGSDSFSYKANDGTTDSNTGLVQITVTPNNDSPIAMSKTVITPTFAELKFELDASDVEDDPLDWAILSRPVNGSLINTGSHISYISTPGFIGSDSFTFQVYDGFSTSNTATITIDVGSNSNPPEASHQSIVIEENETASITVEGSDIDNDPLTYRLFASPTHGVLEGTLPNIRYTPNRGFTGNDRFTFASNDGTSDSLPGFITITVQPMNDAPLAIDGTGSTHEDTELTLSLDAFDQDGDFLDWTIQSDPEHGTLAGLAPNLTYIPYNDYSGTDQFSFSVNDGALNSNTANFVISVTPNNDQPTAQSQNLVVNEDETLDIELAGTDKEGDTLTYTIISAPSKGSVSGTPPTISYSPQQGFSGTETFTFRVNDGTSDSEAATVTITVSPVNDAPIANSDSISLDEDSSRNITLGASDPDGDSLTYRIIKNPVNGTLTGNASDWVYTPTANFSGTDYFEFIVNDGVLDSPVATVTLDILDINDAPTATSAQYSTLQSQSLTIVLTGTDPENDSLSTLLTNQPSHGDISGDTLNIVYTAEADFEGEDSFQFVVNDGQQQSAPATISITVEGNANTAPVADAGDDATTPLNIPISLSGEDSTDDDNDTLSYQWSIASSPENSSAGLSNSGSDNPTFTPDLVGTYEIKLIVNDGQVDSIEDRVTITVVTANELPIAHAGSNRTIKPNELITLSGVNSYDPEFGELTYRWQITNQPDNSSLQLSSPISIEPLFQADTAGDYIFALVVNDGINDSLADEVIITVSANTLANTKPTAVAEYAIGIDDFEEYFITLSADKSFDPDGDILTYSWTLLSQHANYNSIPDNDSEQINWPISPDNQQIQLVVSDGNLDSDPVTIDIPDSATMTPMVLFNSETQLVEVSDEVALEVDAFDYDSDITFTWSLISKPGTSSSTIDEPNSQFTFFIPDTAGKYEVEIEVSDASPSGIVKRRMIVFANAPGNTPPVPNINSVTDIDLNGANLLATFDASNSYDPDGDALGYFWELTTPDQSKAKLNDATSPSPSFSVDQPGVYSAILYLDDGYTQVDDDVEVHVYRNTNTPPIASAGVDQTGSTGAAIVLDGSGSFDDDGDPLTFNWQLISQPVNSSLEFDVASGALEQPSFTPSLAGEYVFSLFVSDWSAMSTSDTVSITVVEVNKAPQANTGQTSGQHEVVTTLNTIQLNGSASSDPENDSLTYSWVIHSAPVASAAQIVNADSYNPVFTPDVQGRYTVKLKVNDGELDSQYAFYSLWAYNTNNQAPIAIAEAEKTDFIDTVIYLDGSAAYDPDGDEIAARRWQALVGPSGARVTIAPPYGEKPFFQANLPGFYLIGYTVNDGELTSANAYQRITLIGPTPPVANAGNDQTGTTGRQLSFDGGNSSDADGDKLSYSWTVITRPASSQFTLLNADNRVMDFSADTAGEYVIQLEVSDGYSSTTDTVRVTFEDNKAPSAHLDIVNPIDPFVTNYQIIMDAGLSTDPEGDDLSYSWALVEQPTGSNTRIVSYNSDKQKRALLSTYVVGQYKVALTANDGELDSVMVTKTFTVEEANTQPVANATLPTQVSLGKLFTVDASDSFDEDNDPLKYQWSIISAPDNSNASLIGANSVQTDFTPDKVGDYQIQLVVNDGKDDSVPLIVTVTSIDNNNRPQAYASYSHAVIVNDVVEISGWASDDEDDDPLTYSWQMTHKPATSQATLNSTTIMEPTFIADKAGSYTLSLIVNDGLVNSDTHTVTITAVVDTIGLPNHPGEAGKQTLLGIDDDNDGVRDDIQRHIFATYPADSQENLRLALSEMAKTYQTLLWEAMDPNQAYGNAIDMGLHLECLAYLIDEASYDISTKLYIETINTMDRYEAYLAYDSALSGEIFPTSQIDDFKNSCTFQLN